MVEDYVVREGFNGLDRVKAVSLRQIRRASGMRGARIVIDHVENSCDAVLVVPGYNHGTKAAMPASGDLARFAAPGARQLFIL